MTTNDTTATNSTATNTAAEPGTGTPPRGLAARAITAARRYRATDPPGTTTATPTPGGHAARLPPAR